MQKEMWSKQFLYYEEVKKKDWYGYQWKSSKVSEEK